MHCILNLPVLHRSTNYDMIFIYPHSPIHQTKVRYEPTKRPAPSWLISSIGRTLDSSRRSCVHNCDDSSRLQPFQGNSHRRFSFFFKFICSRLSDIWDEPRSSEDWKTLKKIHGLSFFPFRLRSPLNFLRLFFLVSNI